jgi:hypothetical protein
MDGWYISLSRLALHVNAYKLSDSLLPPADPNL